MGVTPAPLHLLPAPASSPKWWTSRPKGTGRSSWTLQGRTLRSRTGECQGEGLEGGCLPLGPPPTLPHPSGPDRVPQPCRFAARPDCGSKYQLCVQLLSSAHAPLGTFQPDPATIQQKSDARWREVRGLVGQGRHLPGRQLSGGLGSGPSSAPLPGASAPLSVTCFIHAARVTMLPSKHTMPEPKPLQEVGAEVWLGG